MACMKKKKLSKTQEKILNIDEIDKSTLYDFIKPGSRWTIEVSGKSLYNAGLTQFDAEKNYQIKALHNGYYIVGMTTERFFVRDRDFMFAYFNSKLEPLTPFQYSEAEPFNDYGLAQCFFTHNGHWGWHWIDEDWNVVPDDKVKKIMGEK